VYNIVRDTIDPRRLEALVRTDVAGGIVTFAGIVRATADDGRPVQGLSYEAFEPMAVAEFERIADEARQRFGDVRLAIAHRIGELAVGEIAVAIVAAAAHRGIAFDACRYAIDEVKRRAPIWKKERYADGAAEWKVNAARE
jgi:molybdopterin synthase catalytic subunit